jgi:hypothetical protein
MNPRQHFQRAHRVVVPAACANTQQFAARKPKRALPDRCDRHCLLPELDGKSAGHHQVGQPAICSALGNRPPNRLVNRTLAGEFIRHSLLLAAEAGYRIVRRLVTRQVQERLNGQESLSRTGPAFQSNPSLIRSKLFA